MNKIIENPDTILEDMVEGYLVLNQGKIRPICDEAGQPIKGALTKVHGRNKVSIVIGGGAGNEPWCLEYVGKGMADAVVSGNVYMAPPAFSLLEAGKGIYHEKGILFVGTNHMGDLLNFELVGELLATDPKERIETECVFVNDDVVSDEKQERRRGIAGIFYAVKMAGAASEKGLDLAECKRITQKAIDRTRTMTVTTSAGVMPSNGIPMADLPDGYVEYGMGFNGEPGIRREKLPAASAMTEYMLETLMEDLKLRKGEELAVLISGLGGSSRLELLIVVQQVSKWLRHRQIPVFQIEQADIFCPQETGGFSVTVLALDEELKPYFLHPAEIDRYHRE